jgi:hypothetical protein
MTIGSTIHSRQLYYDPREAVAIGATWWPTKQLDPVAQHEYCTWWQQDSLEAEINRDTGRLHEEVQRVT